MNRIFRLIFSRALGAFVVASELASSRGRASRVRSAATLLISPLALLCAPAWAQSCLVVTRPQLAFGSVTYPVAGQTFVTQTDGGTSGGNLYQSVGAAGGNESVHHDGAAGNDGGAGSAGNAMTVLNCASQTGFPILAQSTGGGGGYGEDGLPGGDGGRGGDGGNLLVENLSGGSVSANSGNGVPGAIYVVSAGGNGGSAGNGELGADGGSGGNGGNGGTVNVLNDAGASVSTTGDHVDGIHIESDGGTASEGGSGGWALWGHAGNGGAGGNSGSDVSAVNNGAITTSGADSEGIYAHSVGGNGGNGGSELSGGIVSVGGSGGAGGLGGAVTIYTAGTIATSGSQSEGIDALSIGGGGGDGGNAIAAFPLIAVAIGGSGGSGGDGGSVFVQTEPDASIRTAGANAAGISARTIGGGGGDGGYANAFAVGGTVAPISFALSIGGSGGSGGNGGATPSSADSAAIANAIGSHQVPLGSGGFATYVANAGTLVTGDLSLADQWSASLSSGNGNPQALPGDSSDGILAQSIGGGGGHGGNVFNVSAAVGMTTNLAVSAALGGSGGSGGDGENVGVNNLYGTITTYGRNANGIVAQSIGGGGGSGGNTLSVAAEAGGSLSGQLGLSLGGSGGSGGAAGVVMVNPGQSVTTMGTGSVGILAQSVGGGGGNGGSVMDVGAGVSANSVTLMVSLGGKGGSGGTGNTVLVSNDGFGPTTLATFGDNADGVLAQSIGGGGGNGGSVNTYAVTVAGGYLAGTVNVGVGGSGGTGGTGGEADVYYSGNITTYGDASAAVKAQSIGGGGGNGGSVQALSIAASFNAQPQSSAQTLAVTVGGSGGTGQDGGDAHVELAQNTTLKTEGERSVGIMVQSIGGGGGNGGSVSSFALSTAAPNLDTLKQFVEGEIGAYLTQYVSKPASTAITDGAVTAVTKFKWSLQDGEGEARTGDANDAGQSVKNQLAAFTSKANSLIQNANDVIKQNADVNDTISTNNGIIAAQTAAQATAQQAVADYVSDLKLTTGSTIGMVQQQVQSELTSAQNSLALAQAALAAADPSHPDYATAQNNVTKAQAAVSEIQTYASKVAATQDTLAYASNAIAAAHDAIAKAKSSPYYSDDEVNPDLVANANSVKQQAAAALKTAQEDPVKNADEADQQLAEADVDNNELNKSVGNTAGDGDNTDDNGGGDNGGGTPPKPTKIPSVTVNVAVGGSGGAAGDGKQASAELRSGAQIITQGGQSYGMLVQSIGGGGGTGGHAQSDGFVGVNNYTVGFALGGFGSGGGNGGAVNVGSESNTSITTSGDAAYGILAQSIGGGGGEGGVAQENFSASISRALGITDPSVIVNMPSPKEQTALTIGGYGGNAGHGGDVNVDLDTAITTTGTNAMGIVAQSIGGGGGSGNIAQTQSSMFEFDLGGSAGAGGNGGTVNVAEGGVINTTGSNAVGILAQSIGGGGGNGGVAQMSEPVSSGEVDVETEISTRSLSVSPTVPWDLKLSVGGKGGAAGNGGDVTVGCGPGAGSPVACAGSITTSGAVAHAIQAQSIGGGGGTSQISNLSPGQGDISFQVWKGISYGNSGTVTVNDNASSHFTIATSGDGAMGIVAQSLTNGGGSLSIDAATGLYSVAYYSGDDDANNGDGGADAGKPAGNAPDNGGDATRPLINAGCVLPQGCTADASVNGGTVVNLYGSVTTTGRAAYGIYAQSLSAATTVFTTEGAQVGGGTELVTGLANQNINAIEINAGARVITSGDGAHGIVSLTNSNTPGTFADLALDGNGGTNSHVQNTVINGAVSVSGANAWGLLLENGSAITSGVNPFWLNVATGANLAQPDASLRNARNVVGLQVNAGGTVQYTGVSDGATSYGQAGAVMVNNFLGSAFVDVSGSIQAPDAIAVSVSSYGMQSNQDPIASSPRYTLDVHSGGSITGGIILSGASSSLSVEQGGNVTGYLAIQDATSAGAMTSGSGNDNGASVADVTINGVFTGTNGAHMLASNYNPGNLVNHEGAVVDIDSSTKGDVEGVGAYIAVAGTLTAGSNTVAAIHVISPTAPASIIVSGQLLGAYGGTGDVIHVGMDDGMSMARIINQGTILGNIAGPGVATSAPVFGNDDGNSIVNQSGGLIDGQVFGIHSYDNGGTHQFDLPNDELPSGAAFVNVGTFTSETGSKLRVNLTQLPENFTPVTLIQTVNPMAANVIGTLAASGIATTLDTSTSTATALNVKNVSINYKVAGLSGDLLQAAQTATSQVQAIANGKVSPQAMQNLNNDGLYSLLLQGANATSLAALSGYLGSLNANANFSDAAVAEDAANSAANALHSCGGAAGASHDPIEQGECDWVKATYDEAERRGGQQSDSTRGLAGGVQREVGDDVFVGASANYGDTRFNGGLSSAKGHRAFLGGIVKTVRGNAFGSVSLVAGDAWGTGRRTIPVPGGEDAPVATSNHRASILASRLRAGYKFGFNAFDVLPVLDLNLNYVRDQGYREVGAGTLDMRVRPNTNVNPDAHPFVQIGSHLNVGKASMRAYLELGERFRFNDVHAVASMPDAFDQYSDIPVVQHLDRRMTTYAAGAVVDWTDKLESRLVYEQEEGDTSRTRNVSFKFAWKL